jgi:uncharacterized protein YeaO (DUF488 family)
VTILLKRAYDTPSRSDGYRILVERLWPRGVAKQHAKIDLWLKEAAPSTELRRWFNHDPNRWVEFKRKYFRELDSHEASVHPILERVRAGPVTFIFASRELRFNNAVALKEYVERSGDGATRGLTGPELARNVRPRPPRYNWLTLSLYGS